MDKLDQLLLEAKPLYLKRKQNRRIISGVALSTYCAVFLCLTAYQQPAFDNDDFATYYTALYEPLNDDYFQLDINPNNYFLLDENRKAI
ncbi:MAG: hypothetical protein Q4D80_00525 [Pseudomonadota bacterium]|nr:hypothetical protein [Pseudomonadota bacterium]